MGGKSALELLEGRQPRVLACDDSEVNLAMVTRVLERGAFHVTRAHSGEEVLETVERQPFDLVLIDINLPGINGIDVCRKLREQQTSRVYLPIIMLTANTEKHARVTALQAGATDFITKPFNPDELLARIHNHIAAKRLHDHLFTMNQILEEEQAKVFKVQTGLLPASFPTVDGLRFGGAYKPFSMAGGDFYDAFERPDGTIILAISDISGHGIPAAMHMSTLRATLHSEADAGADLITIMERLNRILCYCLDPYSFVTFYLATFNPQTGELIHTCAGHHPPLLHDLESNVIKEIPVPITIPMGVDLEEFEPKCSTHQIMPGQRLYLYTDGIIEQRDRAGNFFEMAGLTVTLKSHLQSHVEFIPSLIMATLEKYLEGRDQSDDLTMLVMETPKDAPDKE
ncbi:MAG: fused response regulator/phosphatase [Candidatus Sumerlaeia bacterium]|nr:fused response regulator/phosphatase [Candidatus Sumerlaeia bacterium]